MKFLLLLFLMKPFGHPKPIEPLKPWTHDMCQVRQAYATEEYIAYCEYESPGKHPRCAAGDPTGRGDREAYKEAVKESGGKGARFEYWDCSWHPRQTARK